MLQHLNRRLSRRLRGVGTLYAAALDVHYGERHVILLGFRPQWRGQTFGTFKILFDAALYGSEFAEAVSGDEKFWVPLWKEMPTMISNWKTYERTDKLSAAKRHMGGRISA